ncbi:MAG: class I adenylate-forming enzyme family protein [Paracoccaceae bacterium]
MIDTKTLSFGRTLYERLVKRDDDIVIIDSDDRAVTANQLLQRSRAVAHELSNRYLKAADRVVISISDNVDALVCIIACWYLCATPVLIDFRTPPAQRQKISQLVSAKFSIEDRHPKGAGDYDHVTWNDIGQGNKLLEADFPDFEALALVPAFLSLSSGTTGFPKAYVLSHAQVGGRILTRHQLEGSGTGTFYTPMTLSFSATRQVVLNYLAYEGKVIFGKPLFSASELVESILDAAPTGCALPPPIIRNLVAEVGDRKNVIFPSLNVLRSIGGPASIEDKLGAYKNLTKGYRMGYSSSLTGVATVLAGENLLKRPETTGVPIDGINLEICDPDTLAPLPVGQSGLIKVQTPYLSAKIITHNDTQASNEFLDDGWASAGDLGFLDADGFLTLTGRLGYMIVRGGVNIAPQEVENTLRAHPSVDDVAILGIEDEDVGEEVAAIFVSKTATEKELFALCMRQIAPESRPRIIKLVEQLPYNLNNKLDRNKLRSLL